MGLFLLTAVETETRPETLMALRFISHHTAYR